MCRKTVDIGCSSVTFPTHGVSYSKVCGRVYGYQKGTTEDIRTALGVPLTSSMLMADFRARERVEATFKSVLWLSWLPHTLLSSPNLGKAKVRPPSPCRPSYSTVPFKICSVCTGGAFDPPTQRTINIYAGVLYT